jgi:hypothetical protein
MGGGDRDCWIWARVWTGWRGGGDSNKRAVWQKQRLSLSVEWTGRPMSMSMSMSMSLSLSLTSLCCRSGCQTEGVRVVSQLMVVDGECSNKQPLAALA